jgi:triosephosphate isomerase
MFGGRDDAVTLKALAAIRKKVTPVVCIGELMRTSIDDAVNFVLSQGSILMTVPSKDGIVWASGAAESVEYAYDEMVMSLLLPKIEELGGVRQDGTYSELGAACDGLILERFAHGIDPLKNILDNDKIGRRCGGCGNRES